MAVELFTAIKSGNTKAVERLLDQDRALVDARDESGLSPVLAALYRGHNVVAAATLRRRPTLDVFEAAAAGDAARVLELVGRDRSRAGATSSDGYSALGLAAFFKRRDVVRILLEAGADVRPASRAGGFKPPHSAAGTDAGPSGSGIVRALSAKGADSKSQSPFCTLSHDSAAFTRAF